MARPGFITNPDDVAAVLLEDGKWYDVVPGSFELGAWEVARSDTVGGSGSGVEAARLGFRFTVDQSARDIIAGPINALAAVRIEAERR